MGTVYVIQAQHRWDEGKGALVPKFDLSSAEQYGEISYLLSPTASPFHPEPIIAELRQKLHNFDGDDYLLLVGNPCLIGFATAIAADFNEGVVNLLQWSGKDRSYIPVAAELFPEAQ